MRLARSALLFGALLACRERPLARVDISTLYASADASTLHTISRDPTVAIAAGCFLRGRADGRPDEAPVRRVCLSAFAMDAHLVTREAFGAFVREAGYRTDAERQGMGFGARLGMRDWEWERTIDGSWQRPNLLPEDAYAHEFVHPLAPAVMVSWRDAAAYCAAQGKRLPTEAEWEYAMRAGSQGTRYPWGDEAADASGQYLLNYWQGKTHAENSRADGYVYVSPINAYPPNAWGLYDPVGNVWQWTSDWYAHDAYGRASEQDPRGPDAGVEHVARGGSWWCGKCTCEGNGLYYRGKGRPNSVMNNNGFRCAAGM